MDTVILSVSESPQPYHVKAAWLWQQLEQEGKVDRKQLYHSRVEHDDDCAIFTGQPRCSCDPSGLVPPMEAEIPALPPARRSAQPSSEHSASEPDGVLCRCGNTHDAGRSDVLGSRVPQLHSRPWMEALTWGLHNFRETG